MEYIILFYLLQDGCIHGPPCISELHGAFGMGATSSVQECKMRVLSRGEQMMDAVVIREGPVIVPVRS